MDREDSKLPSLQRRSIPNTLNGINNRITEEAYNRSKCITVNQSRLNKVERMSVRSVLKGAGENVNDTEMF